MDPDPIQGRSARIRADPRGSTARAIKLPKLNAAGSIPATRIGGIARLAYGAAATG
jgi:hypothetical protein